MQSARRFTRDGRIQTHDLSAVSLRSYFPFVNRRGFYNSHMFTAEVTRLDVYGSVPSDTRYG